ncbi:MAG: hypothetical protein U1D28_11035 [Burkholderiales bacterium]|nr:hypothetical protein [Burkholderiales bacterium]
MTERRNTKPEQARPTNNQPTTQRTAHPAPLVPHRRPFPASNTEARLRHWAKG